jgi:hypothetical protein
MKKSPAINSLVVFNHQPDAAVFRVKEVKGTMIGVVDRSLEDSTPNQAIHWIDCSFARPLSLGQLARL